MDDIMKMVEEFVAGSPQTDLQDVNLLEPFNFETLLENEYTEDPALAPIPTLADMESLVGAENQNQPMEPTSYQGSSIIASSGSATMPNFIHNSLPLLLPNSTVSLFDETQSSHPLSSIEGLISEREVSSFQGYDDMAQPNYFDEFANIDDSFLPLQGTLYDEHNQNNPLLVPNVIGNDSFNGMNNYQSSTYPSLSYSDSAQPRLGIETGYSTGQIDFPPQNQISTNYGMCNSRPEHNQFSTTDVYDAQLLPNYRSQQPFITMQNQVDDYSVMQQNFDLRSQTMSPINSMCPSLSLEPHSNLKPTFETMRPNTNERDYRSVLREPAAPSASSFGNYGQQSSLLATMSNSFGSASSVPPTNQMFPPLYENRNQYHHPQVLMPNYHGQQSDASIQHWSDGVRNHIGEYNRSINAPSLKWQRNSLHGATTLPSSFTTSQTPNSIIPGLSTTKPTEGTSSQFANSRKADIASILRQVASPANEHPVEHDKGKLPGSSSTREPSEAIRRILNMNPNRTVTYNAPITSSKHNESRILQIGKGSYEMPRRGRPPKGFYDQARRGRPLKKSDAEESPSPHGKKVPSQTVKIGTNSTSQAVNRHRNETPATLSIAPRNLVNTVYDLESKGESGAPIDPHLRLFKPPTPKGN